MADCCGGGGHAVMLGVMVTAMFGADDMLAEFRKS
jgi:hypothetical protein